MNPSRTALNFWKHSAALLLLLPAFPARAASAQSVTFVPNAARFAGVGTSSGGYNTDLGVASATRLSGPTGLAFDGAGDLIIADRNNNCVRRVDTSSSRITTTIAGLATGAGDTCNTASNAAPSPAQGLLSPADVAADVVGNVFIADTGHNCVRILPAGATGVARLTTVAGTCGATNTASTTPVPTALKIDPAGNLYILLRDTAFGTYQVLRRSSSSGYLCRVAGAPSSQGVPQCSDVSNTVTLNGASGLGMDGGNALYIADTNNNCVRMLAGGTFTTAVGTCGSATSVITAPVGVTFSPSGFLFVTSTQNNQLVRYNQNTGALLLIAGNPNTTPGAYSATQDGAASSAVPLNGPVGLVEDGNNNLFLADSGNNIIRELRNGNQFGSVNVGQASLQQVLTFQVNTASNLTVTPGQDYAVVPGTNTCSGPQTPSAAGSPPAFCSIGVTFTPTLPGKQYSPLTIRDTSAAPNSVAAVGLQGVGVGPWAVLLPGQANTFASGPGTALSLTSDSLGRLYALVQPTGGQPQVLQYPAGGGAPSVFLAAGSGMQTPTAIALDAAGNLYVADTTGSTSSGPAIERYGADGSVNTNYITGITAPAALVVDGYGNMLIAEQGSANDILKVFVGGGRTVVAGGGTVAPADGAAATAVQLGKPAGVALSPDGLIYISDAAAHRVYSVDTSQKIHPVAGTGSTGTAGSTSALSQAIGTPAGLDVDAAGDLYIADTAGNRVFLYFPASDVSGNLLPIFGTGVAGNTGDGGVSNKATLNQPTAVSVTPDGLVHVADSGNNAIRVVSFPAETIDFGSVAVGSTNTGFQPLVNTGNANLIRTLDPVVSNTNFAYDAGDSTCSSIVIDGQLCNFAFSFSPTTTGPKTAVAMVMDNAPNSPQTINLTATVVPAVITSFTAAAETETYGGPYVGSVTITTNGGTVPTGTLTFTVNGTVTCSVTGQFVGTATCTLPGGTLLPFRATPYPVTVTFTAGNYPDQSTTTTLTVQPRTLTETVNNQSKVYLQPNPTLTGTPNGVLQGVGSDSFTLAYGFAGTPITTTTAPGVYTNDITATATPSAGTVASNYNVVIVPGTFTITQGSIAGFGANPETEVYGGAYTGTASYSSGAGATAPTGTVVFRNGSTTLCSTAITTATTCSVAAGTGLQAGTYTITVAYSGDTNYAAATATTTLTVTPAPLTVTVANQTKTFGAPVPNLTGSATVTGLVNGDAVGSTIILTYSTTVTSTTPIGTYPGAITVGVSGSSAASYTLTSTPGTFIVGGVSTTTALTTSATPVAAGAPVTFTATVASTSAIPAGTVVFTSDSVVLGTVTLDATGKATLTISSLTAGTHTIRASYSGNASFASSSATLTQTITVPFGSFSVTAPSDPQYIRGAGTRTFTVRVVSNGGFAGTVALACSGLPADATCSLSSNSVALTAGASQTVTVTTTTTLADAKVARNVVPSRGRNWPGALGITAAAVFPLQLGGLGMLLAGLRRRRKVRVHHLLLVLLLSLGLFGMAGCGSGAFFHIYPVTVTGTSVGGGPAPSSTTVYLAVGTP